MFLQELNLKFFRNYNSLKIKFDPFLNIICGDNAQGKTNLLESIYFLSLNKSHRTNEEENLIKEGQNKFKIKGNINNKGNKIIYEIIFRNNEKIFKIDNKEIKKINDYITNNVNIILFNPQDLEIIQGSPGIRREYLNTEIGQISNNYLNILSEYNKLLKIRNDYLKKMANNKQIDLNYFDIVTTYLIEKGYIICKMREKFINEINNSCSNIFNDITGLEKFKIEYITNFDFKNDNYKIEIFKKYKKNLKKEIHQGKTLLGPHRDDFVFLLDEKNLKVFGSQGQQRIAILSIKLSEIKVFEKYKSVKPIVLLDDIFSELDLKKRKKIINFFDKDVQIIITTTDLKNINKKILEKSKIIKIKDGKINNTKEVEIYGK